VGQAVGLMPGVHRVADVMNDLLADMVDAFENVNEVIGD
jgi:hypothetical protein